ncbi:MAG: GNAT family N-acetyltransferase [Litoreibacter sp.]|nr:GNAT family N-acetyltransferase [Litoreibacter sp.]
MGEVKRIAGAYDWAALLRLLQNSFAYMEGRIDPPSSLHAMSAQDIAEFADAHAVVVIEEEGALAACVFLRDKPDALYLGKLAVSDAFRRRGFARRLVDFAEALAREKGRTHLELQTRIELTENHAAFAKMGFVKTSEGRHPGFDRVTEITMRKAVSR